MRGPDPMIGLAGTVQTMTDNEFKMRHLRGIPIVESGQKYQTEKGFSAIKDGIKPGRDTSDIEYGSKPN